MATSWSKSVSHGSEETFDAFCSPCSEEGKTREAKNFCIECGLYYCEKCLKHHNKVPSARSHQIVDKSEPGIAGTVTALPTERCVTHHGKILDMYCQDHEAVCCSACIAVKHRTCVEVDYIPDIAAGIKDSQEYKETKENIDLVLSELQQRKTKKLEILSKLEQQTETLYQEINQKEEVKRKVSILAQMSREELQLKHDEIKAGIEEDVTSITGVIAMIGANKEKLTKGNDSQLFLNIKTGKKAVKDAELTMPQQAKNPEGEELIFIVNKDLEQILSTLVTLGNLHHETQETRQNITPREYTATVIGKYKVHEKPCTVRSFCILQDGTAVSFMSSDDNSCLKRVSMEDFRVLDELKMECFSPSVCSVSPLEVAVALHKAKKIQFVSVTGKMTLTRSFTTDIKCCGIAYNESYGQLYISNDGSLVNVYDIQGNCVKCLECDNVGNKLFSRSRNITWIADRSTIIVTDYKNGLLALDISGALKWKFTDPDLCGARAVCVLPDDIILVGGMDSRNVLQVDRNGKRIDRLIDFGDSLSMLWTLAYDQQTSRLIVGPDSNELFVYTLTVK